MNIFRNLAMLRLRRSISRESVNVNEIRKLQRDILNWRKNARKSIQ